MGDAITRTNISVLSGKVVGVDANIWLCKSYNKLVTFNEKAVVDYFHRRLQLFAENNIQPIFVFDGKTPPLKEGTVEDRRKSRDAAGSTISTGSFSRLIRHVIVFLEKFGVEVIEAPYESDVQLAKLERDGIISAVITEDSDLIVHNCRFV